MASQCRVVVTGLGVVCPLGLALPHVWSSLISGKSGIVRIPSDFCPRHPGLMEKLPSKVAALVPRGEQLHEFNVNDFSASQRRQVSMSTLFALRATAEALRDAGFDDPKSTLPDSEKDDFGVAMGVGMIDLEEVYETGDGLYSKGYSKVSPYFVPRILPNLASGQIAIANGFRGPNHCVSTACATGAHAIGDAFTLIKRRQASVMVCGGSEASATPLGIAGFCRLRALSTRFNDRPTEASRPFDAERDGFVIGEGCGAVVLEEYEHAVRRRAPKIYAEVLGYGLSGDGFHITSPDKEGRGAFLCMRRALDDAGLKILCLHGYRQNADAFRVKTGGLRKFLSKVADFYFITAPHVANVDQAAPADNKVDDESDGGGRQPGAWWFSRPNSQFSSRDVTDLCDGFEETVSLVHKTFKEQGPFDGILGFSQGACLTALICSLKARGEFSHDFHFVILFAGFQSGSSPHRHLIDTRLTTPSLHVIGETDGIISEAMSKALIDQFEEAVVIKHPRGHMVPSSKDVGRAVAEFSDKFRQSASESRIG